MISNKVDDVSNKKDVKDLVAEYLEVFKLECKVLDTKIWLVNHITQILIDKGNVG